MTTAKRSRIALPPEDAPATKDEPVEAPSTLTIGPASPTGSIGWLMGIGSRAETAAEHNTRLGASAGKFNDAGFLLGNLAPRVGWPMGNVVVPVTEPPTPR